MPFVNAISNLGSDNSSPSSIIKCDYVQETEKTEKTEEYCVTDSCVDTDDLDKYLKLNDCTHLQLLSETASINNYSNISVEDLARHLNHLSTSSESIYDNIKPDVKPQPVGDTTRHGYF